MSTASLIAMATRLIAKKGSVTTLRVFPAGTPNATKPWRPGAATPTDHTGLKMAFVPYGGKPSMSYADGSLARLGDLVAYVSAENIPAVPDLGSHLVRADGSVWAVMAKVDYEQEGTIIAYELWVRR